MPPTLEKNITSFEKILAIVQNDYLSKEELLKMLEKIVAMIKDMKETQNTTLDNLESTYRNLLDKFKKDKDSNIAELKMMVERETQTRLKEMSDSYMTKMDDWNFNQKDCEESMVQNVLARVPMPEMDTPEMVRDKLESLKDNERLDKQAVKGLEDEIKKLNEKIDKVVVSKGGGSRKVPIIKRYNLTSSVDGSTKTFTLPLDTVDVIGVYGTQFPINFNPGTDWTFAGRTLTLADAVGAPQSGQTFYAIIETLFYG